MKLQQSRHSRGDRNEEIRTFSDFSSKIHENSQNSPHSFGLKTASKTHQTTSKNAKQIQIGKSVCFHFLGRPCPSTKRPIFVLVSEARTLCGTFAGRTIRAVAKDWARLLFVENHSVAFPKPLVLEPFEASWQLRSCRPVGPLMLVWRL